MDNKVKAIPEGYHTVTPYVVVREVERAIEFYKDAFGAEETVRMPGKSGKVGHAEIRIGESTVMLTDENPAMGVKAPPTLGGSPVSLVLYVEDADEVFDRAVGAGGRVRQPMKDQFFGDRMGGVEDPFGHTWYIATHKEDVPQEELRRRAAAAMA